MRWILSYLENSDSTELIQLMEKHFSDELENSKGISPETSSKLFKAIHDKIRAESKLKGRRVIPLRKVAVAASVIGVLLLTTFLFINKTGTKEIANVTVTEHQFKDDVSPGGNK